jgi:hypothetical protein
VLSLPDRKFGKSPADCYMLYPMTMYTVVDIIIRQHHATHNIISPPSHEKNRPICQVL